MTQIIELSAYVLIALCGLMFLLFNELEDECIKSTWKKYVTFLNTNKSWKNKWRLDIFGNQILNPLKKWYYFGINPKYKERFYLSSTILVFLTDGEHLFQFFKKRSIELAFLILSWKLLIAWTIGTMIMQLIKEKFLKNIN